MLAHDEYKITRHLEKTLLYYLEQRREILAVVGPRQCGKTTLLKHIQNNLTDSVYLSFEDRDELELFEKDIKGFAKRYIHFRYIFIDEFQYAKTGGKNLKYIYDTYPETKIIVTGSSALDLSVKTVKYLVGRILVFHLYPLNFSEFIQFKAQKYLYEEIYLKLKRTNRIDFHNPGNFKKTVIFYNIITSSVKKQFNDFVDEFIVYGGYPSIVMSDSPNDKRILLKNIYNTYFLREVRDILGLIDDFKLSNLIKALALQIGNLVEYKELSTVTQYDYVTLKKYLNFLEKTFITQMVRPYFVNRSKEIVKNPKVYFYDSGLRNVVLDDFRSLSNRTDKGALYENMAFSNFIKNDIQLNFWRTKGKTELDFVYQKDALIIAIECKSALKDKHEVPSGLVSFLQRNSSAIGFVFNEELFTVNQRGKLTVRYLPYWML